MVKVLERDGFVKRSVNRDDGRSIRIKPTSKGRAAIENAWALHHRNIETIVAGMSRAKRAELLTSVVALGGRLEDHKPQRGR
jgi:DNA-binding MarR family transcriptional regulator